MYNRRKKKTIFQKIVNIIGYSLLSLIGIIFFGTIIIETHRDEINRIIENRHREKKKCENVCESKKYKIINDKCICSDGREYDLNK